MRGRIRRKTKVPTVQTELKIGQPGDKYEQEADAVADRVVSNTGADQAVQMQPSKEEEKPVQMQPDEEETVSMKPEEDESVQMQAEGEEQVSMKEEEEVAMKEDEEVSMKEDEEQVSMKEDEEKVSMKEDEEEVSMKEEEEIKKKPAIQKSGDGNSHASPALTNQISQTKGQGNVLGDHTQQELGQKMGADFSSVKIHTDQRASEMNQALGAKAFTHGNDIYFNQGNYDPGSSKGKHLLAHELTHVVQQSPAVQKSETLENVIQRQDNNDQQTTTNKALTSYNNQGWLLVKLDSGDVVSLAKKTRVEYLGYNSDKSRENFKILDWPYAGKKASVSAISASQSRFGDVNYNGGGKVVFEIANKRVKYGSSSWITAYTLMGNEVPVGTHKLWLPDYPHSGGSGYISDSALATIWFRIGGESSSRYLHIGRYTAGCVTVGAVESGDESARQQWTNICNYLLSCRSGNDSVGEIEVKA